MTQNHRSLWDGWVAEERSENLKKVTSIFGQRWAFFSFDFRDPASGSGFHFGTEGSVPFFTYKLSFDINWEVI